MLSELASDVSAEPPRNAAAAPGMVRGCPALLGWSCPALQRVRSPLRTGSFSRPPAGPGSRPRAPPSLRGPQHHRCCPQAMGTPEPPGTPESPGPPRTAGDAPAPPELRSPRATGTSRAPEPPGAAAGTSRAPGGVGRHLRARPATAAAGEGPTRPGRLRDTGTGGSGQRLRPGCHRSAQTRLDRGCRSPRRCLPARQDAASPSQGALSRLARGESSFPDPQQFLAVYANVYNCWKRCEAELLHPEHPVLRVWLFTDSPIEQGGWKLQVFPPNPHFLNQKATMISRHHLKRQTGWRMTRNHKPKS